MNAKKSRQVKVIFNFSLPYLFLQHKFYICLTSFPTCCFLYSNSLYVSRFAFFIEARL